MSSSIPPVPPIPPNSTAPPRPPQINKPLDEQVLNRKILDPVSPTKRAASYAADSITTDHSNEIEKTHCYLLQELAEIFTTQQRQGQA